MASANANSLFATIAAASLGACGEAETISDEIAGAVAMTDSNELIVIAGLRADNDYYAQVADKIFDFQTSFARQVAERDDVLILTDEDNFDRYAAALGETYVAIAPQEDIWMRDFSPSNVESPVMFRYTAAAQAGRQSDADFVQEALAARLEEAGLIFNQSDLLNDGGNFVDDYDGRAVVSRKFLRDNGLSERDARALLRAQTGAEQIAFIEADEQGGLEHADGIVAFIEPNVLVINSYPDDPGYAAALHADLKAGLPSVTIHEITTPYDDSKIYDEKFDSACGLYTNMLVTPSRIYLPQFGVPEDAAALAAMREWTSKEIVPVQSAGICFMGGGVRCMSWQLRGENAARLKAWAQGRDSEL